MRRGAARVTGVSITSANAPLPRTWQLCLQQKRTFQEHMSRLYSLSDALIAFLLMSSEPTTCTWIAKREPTVMVANISIKNACRGRREAAGLSEQMAAHEERLVEKIS